jgi:hypothetical protein
MDHKSTIEVRSKIDPDVVFTIRVVSFGLRRDYAKRVAKIRKNSETNGTGLEYDIALAAWTLLIQDFDGITIDGTKPTIETLFLGGPEVILMEIVPVLNDLVEELRVGDSADEAEIAAAKHRIERAEERIARRKNLEPQSSIISQEESTKTADDVTTTQMKDVESEINETVAGTPV